MILLLLSLVLFFFQAEDGIRDLVRSRGLGDVYKRQALTFHTLDAAQRFEQRALPRASGAHKHRDPRLEAVSYTHLTLPTSDLV